jgi:hypothetical protein
MTDMQLLLHLHAFGRTGVIFKVYLVLPRKIWKNVGVGAVKRYPKILQDLFFCFCFDVIVNEW